MESDILKYIADNYGWVGVFAAFTIFGVVKNYGVMYKYYKNLYKKYFGKNYQDSHSVLKSRLLYWMKYKIREIYLPCPCRRQIVMDLLMIRYREIGDFAEKMAGIDTSNHTPEQLFSVVGGGFGEAIDNAEQEYKATGIPPIVVERFKRWSLPQVQLAIKSIEMICYSGSYDSNEKRMQAIYSIFTALLEVQLAESEKTLTELNGELSGQTYKDQTCR